MLLFASDQSVAQTEESSTTPRIIQSTEEILSDWDPGQRLYVKGELGLGTLQLGELEQWLDQNGTNWVVVLMDTAAGEDYVDPSGRRFTGMDAVEYRLGNGLSNRTSFGSWTDERTGERNGAFFVLFLNERKFSYFGSDTQDKRGLGEDAWIGRLDAPAIAAMRGGGRIIDAAKDTVSSINRQLE